jgi:hypothetical protein
MPIKDDIWLGSPESEETENIEENQTEESVQDTADAEPVNYEQEEPQSLNSETNNEDIEVQSPHITTGKFVSKPKNWGVRIPPHRL